MSEHPPSSTALAEAVARGYAGEGPALELGGLMLAADHPLEVAVRVPLGMLNRHGLVAGATGTGKTRTLQVMAEQLCDHGVPVFAADLEGDLSGLLTPGEENAKVTERAASVGQSWEARGFPVDLYALGGRGPGIPLRATLSSFGPTLLAHALGLTATQESSLGLVFHYADKKGLPLLDLADLRTVVKHLVSDGGRSDREELGGLSSSMGGHILQELIDFAGQGADAFFGEPEFDPQDLLRYSDSGRGILSLLELPSLKDRPAVFSAFLMWLLAELFHDLPEAGELEKPRLVFCLDEAHLLFQDGSQDFIAAVTETVRLVRSKGVSVFLATQSPTDVPDELLGQLGIRVQHQLQAHTPDDARALKATVSTFPDSEYGDLGEVITSLGVGEAVVTVLDGHGDSTPVAWTRLRAPESRMAPTEPEFLGAVVARSSVRRKYATVVDREAARELLVGRLEAGSVKADGDPVSRAFRSPSALEFVRTSAREVARGLFGVGRR